MHSHDCNVPLWINRAPVSQESIVDLLREPFAPTHCLRFSGYWIFVVCVCVCVLVGVSEEVCGEFVAFLTFRKNSFRSQLTGTISVVASNNNFLLPACG